MNTNSQPKQAFIQTQPCPVLNFEHVLIIIPSCFISTHSLEKYNRILFDLSTMSNPNTNNPFINIATKNLTSSNRNKLFHPYLQKPLKHNTEWHWNWNNGKNRHHRKWQKHCNPATKRRLYAKISFIQAILQTHKQDKWVRSSTRSITKKLHMQDSRPFQYKILCKSVNGPWCTTPFYGETDAQKM